MSDEKDCTANEFIPFFGCFCILCMWGCATLGTYNPATGRSEFIAISTSSEIAMGKSIHKEITTKESLSNQDSQIARLNRIGQRLAKVSDRRDYSYKFYLIDKDEVNAYTTPGGNIYFYSGLFNKLETDEEVAGVLAHEIGHCAAKHVVKRFQAALGYNLISALIISQVEMNDKAKKTTAIASNAAMSLVVAAYSRKDEYEADRLGIKYMYLAGFDIDGMIKTLKFLQKESKDPRIPLILRTHPYIDDRVKAAEIEVRLAPSKYKNP